MYYPKNKIKTGLHTNGKDLLYLDTLTPFTGYYYSLYNGTFFEGQSPTKGNRELIPIEKIEAVTQIATLGLPDDVPGYSLTDNTAYIIPTGQTQLLPTFYYPKPTEQDYTIGQFLRYFCKKVNETVFLEINKTDYENLSTNNPRYVYQLYKPFYLFWYITGKSREETATINKKVALRYEKELKLYGLNGFIESIGGYDKFYR